MCGWTAAAPGSPPAIHSAHSLGPVCIYLHTLNTEKNNDIILSPMPRVRCFDDTLNKHP